MTHREPQAQLPKARVQYFVKFYEQTVDMLPHLQTAIYKCAATHLLHYEGLPAKIASCKWDIKDLGMDHNPYVEMMLNEFKRAKAKAEGLQKRGCLPGDTANAVWQAMCTHVVDTLIDGFSRVRKCSFEGRGLMKLDFQTLQVSSLTLFLLWIHSDSTAAPRAGWPEEDGSPQVNHGGRTFGRVYQCLLRA